MERDQAVDCGYARPHGPQQVQIELWPQRLVRQAYPHAFALAITGAKPARRAQQDGLAIKPMLAIRNPHAAHRSGDGPRNDARFVAQ